MPLACNKKADITDRENLLLVISALYLNVGLNLMTLSLRGLYHYPTSGDALSIVQLYRFSVTTRYISLH